MSPLTDNRVCTPWPRTRAARMGYVAAHADAEARMARGEEQEQCQLCGLWYWPSERKEHAPQGG